MFEPHPYSYSRNEKGAYMFGRVDLCDFVLDHPTISRFHAGTVSELSLFLCDILPFLFIVLVYCVCLERSTS